MLSFKHVINIKHIKEPFYFFVPETKRQILHESTHMRDLK